MPIVSAGQFINWCDKCVHSRKGNPFFIFKNASYVFTNTFHGTAFAINYETQFVSFCKAKPKITNMLMQFGLQDRIVGSDDIWSVFFVLKLIIRQSTVDWPITGHIRWHLSKMRWRNTILFVPGRMKGCEAERLPDELLLRRME
jgi:hypothetical protein